MDLRKQIQVTLNNDTVNSNRVDKLETICDDFAIGFLEKFTMKVDYVDDTEIGVLWEYEDKIYTTKELLQIYKDIQK